MAASWEDLIEKKQLLGAVAKSVKVRNGSVDIVLIFKVIAQHRFTMASF